MTDKRDDWGHQKAAAEAPPPVASALGRKAIVLWAILIGLFVVSYRFFSR